jgi:hypothetical protein
MAKKKIKGTVSRDLLALSFSLQSMPSGPLMNNEHAKLVLNIESYMYTKIFHYLPSSKIKNILACSSGPEMGWIEEEKMDKNPVTLSLQNI